MCISLLFAFPRLSSPYPSPVNFAAFSSRLTSTPLNCNTLNTLAAAFCTWLCLAFLYHYSAHCFTPLPHHLDRRTTLLVPPLLFPLPSPQSLFRFPQRTRTNRPRCDLERVFLGVCTCLFLCPLCFNSFAIRSYRQLVVPSQGVLNHV